MTPVASGNDSPLASIHGIGFANDEQDQPDLRPPPTECLRDSFAREDSSAPRCISFFPPRRSRLPRKGLFSFFLVFFFLAIAANYSTRGSTSMRIPKLP